MTAPREMCQAEDMPAPIPDPQHHPDCSRLSALHGMAGCVCQPPASLASLFGAAPDLRCEKCAPTLPPVGERETLRCTARIAGEESGGCGDAIPSGEEYRCLDCGHPFHRDCLRRHFAGRDEKDGVIYERDLSVRALEMKVRDLTRLLEEALASRPSPAPSGEREVNIGLHSRVEIHYHVDQYEAQLVHENEAVLAQATGATPSEALARLAAAPHPDGQGVGP